jgi:hypothetical protein
MNPNEHLPVDGQSAPREGEKDQRRSVSRRQALVRAGWTVPVVLALSLPLKAFAQYQCTHSDIPATAHSDIAASAHVDATDPEGRHSDVPATTHTDVAGTTHVDTNVCP